MVAIELEDILVSLGHEIVVIAPRLNQACALARNANIDLAVLDLNLAGEPSFPVAAILRERAIPFLFMTGYGASGLIDGYRDELTLSKPFARHNLERAIAQALQHQPFTELAPGS